MNNYFVSIKKTSKAPLFQDGKRYQFEYIHKLYTYVNSKT